MRHSKRTDSFCEEDEHFFGSYEATLVNAEESLRLEFDTFEARPPSAEQLAHFTRFRKPVAWVIAAMGSLSLVALVRGFQQNSRGEVVTHTSSRTAISAAARTAISAATRTAAAPWSSSEFVESESPIALVLQPTRSSTSNSELPLLDHPATQASLVNDFTSALLSMCRAAPA